MQNVNEPKAKIASQTTAERKINFHLDLTSENECESLNDGEFFNDASIEKDTEENNLRYSYCNRRSLNDLHEKNGSSVVELC